MEGESNQQSSEFQAGVVGVARRVDDPKLTEMLTELIRANTRLASAPSVDVLCHQAVAIGLAQLGFERMSIWLLDRDRELICGTYGTDEQGAMRDEREHVHAWSDHTPELILLDDPLNLYRRLRGPLYNDMKEQVGEGEMGAAALWNGEEVIGLLYMDNLVSRQPISEEQWRIFELYAATLGHLLSLKRTEEALRAKEELLSQILEIMPVGVFVLSPDERILRFNRSAQEIWEFDPANLDSWSPTARWLHNREPVEKHEWAGRKALWYGERVLHQEVEIVQRDGTRHVLLNSGVPLRSGSGALTGAVVVNQDITESKRHEQKLEAMAQMSQALRPLVGQREVLDTIVSTAAQLLKAEGVAVAMREGATPLQVVAASGAFVPLMGCSQFKDLSSLSKHTMLVGADGIMLLDADVCATDWSKEFAGSPRFVVVAPLLWDEGPVGALFVGRTESPDGEMMSLIGAVADVAADVLQRGQLYDQVRTQATRLDRVMEAVNFGLVLLDPRYCVVLANQHAQENLAHLCDLRVGAEVKEFAGQLIYPFVAPHNVQSRTQEISASGAIFELTVEPLGATGAESGWLLVIHDVTRERAEQTRIQQHHRLAAVGQLAAGIAHDFNNILAVIILYVQLLQQSTELAESDQQRLKVIREQATNASKLIRQILDFSRQTVIERQAIDLTHLLTETLALWERTLPEHITLTLVNEVPGEAHILAEASSIQQALTNLAVNARDAMPEGGELTLLLRKSMVGKDELPPVAGLDSGAWYEILVSDNGTGIAPEHLPQIFDPFFTTKAVGKGTGLGLAQVYGIVQQHGGVVTAQSEVGDGTTITLWLPAFGDEAVVSREADAYDADRGGSETILLVEDNAPAREATTALLEMLGYRVLAATDGRTGFDLFLQYRDAIQLVLSDLVMPGMGGMELYRRIAREKPATCLLIMTGYPVEDEHFQLEHGAQVEWLQKPFTVKQLTAAVRRALDRGQPNGHT